jgi:hypothetical protein
MRQFFSWRIWAAFAALIALAFALKTLLPTSGTSDAAVSGTSARTIDFMAPVFQLLASTDFSVADGVVHGSADAVIDGNRTMHIVDGTLGSNSCTDITAVSACVVFADLLGEAVVWFALVPAEAGSKVTLPPVKSLLGNGLVQLSNGWIVRTATSVDYNCPQETGSLSEFVSKFGPKSTTTIDVAKQRVTAVQCSPEVTASN